VGKSSERTKEMTSVKILNLSRNENPQYQTPGAAGFDLALSEDVLVLPGMCLLAPTGLRMIIPEGFEGQIRLRSSMYKKGIVMPNAPGTIDCDYRGEIFIPIRNVQQWKEVTFKKGERIAQMVIKEVPKIELEYLTHEEFDAYESTSRNEGGFGSTGSDSDGRSL